MSEVSKKSKMIAATAFALGVIAVSGSAYAADTPDNPRAEALVSAIAERFELNSADVRTVVDSVMAQQHDKKATRQHHGAKKPALLKNE